MPYAVKLYAQDGRLARPKQPNTISGSMRDEFNGQFGHPDFMRPVDTSRHHHFLGVWDTVKSVGRPNLKARIEMAPLAVHPQHHQRRTRPARFGYRRAPASVQEYRFDEHAVADAGGRYKEMWFAGVHSDVGGQFPDDHHLSDIALSWMVEEARAPPVSSSIRSATSGYSASAWVIRYPLNALSDGIHANGMEWLLAGGWRKRPVLPGGRATSQRAAPHRADGPRRQAVPPRARAAITPRTPARRCGRRTRSSRSGRSGSRRARGEPLHHVEVDFRVEALQVRRRAAPRRSRSACTVRTASRAPEPPRVPERRLGRVDRGHVAAEDVVQRLGLGQVTGLGFPRRRP